MRPVALDGNDDPGNLVSTSMAVNIQKNSISLETLGWSLHSGGDIADWDGLSAFYVRQCESNPEWFDSQYFKQWYNVIKEQL